MASLYNIENELNELFNIIEEAGGEITDEQYATLEIKQEELKEKLNSYYKAIKMWDGDAIVCKTEKKRINEVQKGYENRIAKLKEAALNAVLKFGDANKNNNRSISLPTVKFMSRATEVVNIDTDRVGLLCSHMSQYVNELYISGVIYTGDDVDLLGILSAVNAICKAEYGEDFEPYTMMDLETLEVEITTKDTIANMFKKHGTALKALGEDPIFTGMNNGELNKIALKRALDCIEANPVMSKLTIANKNTSYSLTIK